MTALPPSALRTLITQHLLSKPLRTSRHSLQVRILKVPFYVQSKVVLSEPKSPLPLLAAFESGLARKLRYQSPTSANFPQGVGQRDVKSISFVGPTVAKPAVKFPPQSMLRAAMLTCLYWAKLGTALMQHYSEFRNLLISPSLQPQVSFTMLRHLLTTTSRRRLQFFYWPAVEVQSARA